MKASRRVDVVIIGAGHNGLTCAAYLAAAGLDTLVVEKNDVVGGAALTEEFHPGFRNSVAAYTVSLLNPEVIADLELARHGLKIVERPAANFWPVDDTRFLLMRGGLAERQAAIARFSVRDAERLPAYEAALARAADVLRDLVLRTPPNFGGGVIELVKGAALGQRMLRLDMARQAHAPRPLYQERRRFSRRHGSRATSSKAPSPSTASSATTRHPRRPARPTCCCTTASAR